MSVSFELNIKDKATPEVRRKLEAVSGSRLNAFIGPRVNRLTQNHFLALPHNKRGWDPVNFWADAARSTNWRASVEGVMVSVNKIGVRQRYQGGHIAPVKAGALTLPVAEQAYGKTAKDFGGQLKLIVIKGKGAWLALQTYEPRGAGDKPKRGGRNQVQGPALTTLRERFQFLFRLVAGVDQDANPNVLPTDDEYAAEAAAGTKEALK